jgi:hypothetical protein
VARAAQRERNDSTSSSANRIAARRRETTSERAPKVAKAAKAKGARGGKGRPSGIARLFKLGVLVAAFLCIGFFVVLVIDVGASLVGSVKLGSDTTISAIWDKVVARVLDEDVPRPPAERPRAPVAAPKPRARPGAPVVERAPVEAARPEEDAKHVETRTDPEVERAKKRLDEILGRL